VSAREWLRETAGPVITLLLCSVLIGACIGFSARANATPVDDVAFLTTIDERGITYTSASKVIGAVHAVCDYLDLGYNLLTTINMVEENSQLGSDSAYFVGVSVGAYCPGHAAGVLA